MTREIIFASFFVLLGSCSNEIKKDRTISNSNETKTEIVQEKLEGEIGENKINTKSYSYRDTIICRNVKFQRDFEIWIKSEKNLNFLKNIERLGDSLIFRTQKSTVILVNEEFDEEKENYGAPTYSFIELNDKTNVATVQVEAYEYSYHVLVDMITGDTITLYGKPIFRKDNTIIFASNVDLESGYTENGFQVVIKDSNGFKIINTTLLDNWGIAKALWLGKNQLLVSKVTLDEKYNKHYKNGILTLNLKECR